MTYLDTLSKLAQAAQDAEPSDHGLLSSVKVQIWSDALDELRAAATPERILQLVAVIEAAKALEAEASKRLRFRDAERYPELCAALTQVRTALERSET